MRPEATHLEALVRPAAGDEGDLAVEAIHGT